MASYSAVQIEHEVARDGGEVNHNVFAQGKEDDISALDLLASTRRHIRNYTTEVIELPNDGRVEISASRRFGKQVTSRRNKDQVTIKLDSDDTIHVVVAGEDLTPPDILQRCGARIPHGPAVLDVMVSGAVFVYSLLLTLLVAYVRSNTKYLSVMMLWFFYVILRMNTYGKIAANVPATLRRKLWHFTGISFATLFMYATIVVVFPMLTRDAFYDLTTTSSDSAAHADVIMPSLKASVGFTLLGMAARRSFHCGKILSHMDVINAILLDNVDIFNLVETLNLRNGDLPLIPKGSVMEISILVACEVAFLVVALEALVPYSLIVLDTRNVGRLKRNVSVRESKDQAVLMVYPYSLLIQNVPFLVIRLVLFARNDTFQLGYVIKNITSILFGTITLIRARKSGSKRGLRKGRRQFSSSLSSRRISV